MTAVFYSVGQIARLSAGLIGLSFFVVVAYATAQCQDVAQTGQMRVLTLNVLFWEVAQREARLERVAALIVQEDVHLILLQEVVGGWVAGTSDSSQDLQERLAQHGLDYERESSFETGVTDILEVKNAILSRCPILFSRSQTLSIVEEQTGIAAIPVRREVSMVRIQLPDLSAFNVYNTHLCAGCAPVDRLYQVEVLLAFVAELEQQLGDSPAFILGGDFNIDARLPDEASLMAYELLGADLVDTYAFVNGCTSCCFEMDLADSLGCTVNVPENPFGAGEAQRIDYLFVPEGSWVPVASQVVFNGMRPDNWVSDHSGVLTTLDMKGGDVPSLAAWQPPKQAPHRFVVR